MESLTDFLINIDQYLIDIVSNYHTWTYAILFLIVFFESGLVIMAFLPGDSLLFVAGALTAMPNIPMEINSLSLLLFIGAVAGDSCNYVTGRYFGEKMFSNPRSRFFKPSILEKTHDFFYRYGGKTIIIARFLPIIRTFAPFVAGMGKMNYRHFMTYNIIGAALWIATFCYAGYFFGDLPFVKNNAKLLLVAVAILSMMPAVIEIAKAKLKNH